MEIVGRDCGVDKGGKKGRRGRCEGRSDELDDDGNGELEG